LVVDQESRAIGAERMLDLEVSVEKMKGVADAVRAQEHRADYESSIRQDTE
jgi:hypothetical protein